LIWNNFTSDCDAYEEVDGIGGFSTAGLCEEEFRE